MKSIRLWKILQGKVTELNHLACALRDETKETEDVRVAALSTAKDMVKQLSEKSTAE